jgi:hypothetical protein
MWRKGFSCGWRYPLTTEGTLAVIALIGIPIAIWWAVL